MKRRMNGGSPRGRDLGSAESLHGYRVARFSRGMHTTQEDAVHTTHGTKTGATSVPLTELPFGLPGRIFRSPMPFGPYDLHGEVYDRFREEQIASLSFLRVTKNVFRRQDVTCERSTSTRDFRCSICPFLIS